MKKLLSALLVAGLVLTGCGSSSNSGSSTDLSEKKIGVIQFLQHDALDAAYNGFVETLTEAGVSENNITLKNASGEVANCETIADQLVNDGYDLIYAIATPAAQAVANKTQDIPVVVAAVTDPEASGLVQSNKAPGTNVTGASDLTPIEAQFDLLTNLFPDAKKVGVIYCSSESNSDVQLKITKEAAAKKNLELLEYSFSDTSEIQSVAQKMASSVDVAYAFTDNTVAANIPAVTQELNAQKVPFICGEEGMVTNGGTATYGINYTSNGQLAGQMALQILKGEAEPASMAIGYLDADKCELTINSDQVKLLGITVPEDLDSQAKYVTTTK